MAERPQLDLIFDGGDCADCGERRAKMPTLPVKVPGDIDLSARDFEGFRRMMLESLAIDNPDRARWSEADMEVMLVELLAASLDRMSFAVDAVFAERFLETAQWPASVVRLLTMIDGVSPAMEALRDIMRQDERERFFEGASVAALSPSAKLFGLLNAHPQLIDVAKGAALAGVNRFEACLSLDDMREKLDEIPLFAQVQVRHTTQGGISIYEASVLFVKGSITLLTPIQDLSVAQRTDFLNYFDMARLRLLAPDEGDFTANTGLQDLQDEALEKATLRTAISYLLTPLLPIGTRLRLVSGKKVGVYLRLCVEVGPTYFRSEVEMAVREVLSARPGGVFEQRLLGFGKALATSDIEAALTGLGGVVGVIISRLQIVGDPASEASGTGILKPTNGQALMLDPDEVGPETGYYVLKLSGGLVG